MYEFTQNILNEEKCDELFILTDNNETSSKFSVKENILFISDIFNLDCNDKKIITKFYKFLIKEYADNSQLLELEKVLNIKCTDFIKAITADSNFPIFYEETIDPIDLLKAYNLKFNFQSNNLFLRLTNIIDILKEFSNIRVVIIPFISELLSENDMHELINFISINHMYLLTFNLNKNTSNTSIVIENKINSENDIIL